MEGRVVGALIEEEEKEKEEVPTEAGFEKTKNGPRVWVENIGEAGGGNAQPTFLPAKKNN